MIINTTNTRSLSVAEIEEFLNAPKPVSFSAINKKEAYKWIENCLVGLEYRKLKRHQKGIVRAYIKVMTGYSCSTVARLIARQRKCGHIIRQCYHRTRFPVIYKREDIVLLAKTDEAHDFISGPATRKILEREYLVYDKKEYERLSGISASHIYNLRTETAYQNTTHYHYDHTRPIGSIIGERRKPAPDGRPGFIRIDSVHQGDSQEFGKGVYHINFIDEVTQWEMVASVSAISERYLMPVLELILETLPFVVLGFHSDNGSEYINKTVAKLLNKLHIDQTKSRPRKSNDNALIETKNGSVVRKHLGYLFIDRSAAPLINDWYQDYFNVYLNFHRPCAFGQTVTNRKGKEKIIYPAKNYETPYQKLKNLPNAKQYLKPGIAFEELDQIAMEFSDNDFALRMQTAKRALFVKVKKLKSEDNLK